MSKTKICSYCKSEGYPDDYTVLCFNCNCAKGAFGYYPHELKRGIIMNKPIVINLFAGPGCGKSTTAAGVFSLLKIHGINAELVTEVAKNFTWEGRKRTLKNQRYVWGKQHNRLFQVMDQVDIIVTDSPLLLGMVYDATKDNDFLKSIYNSYLEFNNINYFLIRSKKYNPAGRNQTEDEAKGLDSTIKNMLINYNIDFNIVPSGWEGVNIITGEILNKLHISLNTKLIHED